MEILNKKGSKFEVNLLLNQNLNILGGDRSFPVAAPRLWIALPHHVKSCQTIDSFEKCLKTHLMSSAY